jgi:transposase
MLRLPRRFAQQITLTAAAQHFGLWASAISRIERGKCRDHGLTNRYRNWLNEHPKKSFDNYVGAS